MAFSRTDTFEAGINALQRTEVERPHLNLLLFDELLKAA
jgi:hypothetical protein